MLIAFLVIAGPAVPCVWFLTVPLYTSTAVVRVEPVVPKIVYATENNGMLPLYREYMNTQVSAIRSATVLNRVLDRDDIKSTHWYRDEGRKMFGDPLSPLERLAKALNVATRPNTQLIGVSMSTRRGNEAKLIADAVVDEYYNVMEERERLEYIRLIGKVRVQYDELDKTIRGLRDLRKSLSKDSGLMDSLELRSQLGTKLNDLESRSMEVDRTIGLLRNRLDRKAAAATQSAGGPNAAQVSGGPDYGRDQTWQNLHMNLKNAQYELEVVREQYGESNIKVRLAVLNVKHAKDLLAEREAFLKNEWQQPQQAKVGAAATTIALPAPQTAKQLLSEKELEKKLLSDDIHELRKKVADIQVIAENEEQLRDKQKVFDTVRDRLTTLETELNAPGRITIDSHGLQPSEPAKDRRPLLVMMALLGAGLAAFGLAYLRIVSDSRIHDAGDIEQVRQIPFLGQLPLLPRTSVPEELGGMPGRYLPTSQLHQESMRTYGTPDGLTALSEGVRQVRTSLLERLGRSDTGHAVLVTSPTSQVGKTSLAVLLARSLASTGKKVLLVEGDFYRPALSERLGLKTGAGLAALLTQGSDDASAIRRTDIPGFDVLPIGDVRGAFNPDVLANGVFASCMARWKRTYNFVVLDSPPVLAVADARILADHADGALLVIRASQNRRMEASAAFNQLSSTRGGVLGVVLIGGFPHGGSYQYGYSSYARAANAAESVPGGMSNADADPKSNS